MSFISLVTQQAIDFTAPTVMPDGEIDDNFNLKSYGKGKYIVLFFYPFDFTFVCPTEIIAFNNKITEFAQRRAELIGISVDSKFSHYNWRCLPISEGGIGKVNYPLVSDITKSISKSYGVLHDGICALRGTIIIDKNFTVRHISINDLPIGRNVDEYLRIIDAIEHHNQYGEVCPAGWKQGDPAMEATKEGVEHYLNSHLDNLSSE